MGASACPYCEIPITAILTQPAPQPADIRTVLTNSSLPTSPFLHDGSHQTHPPIPSDSRHPTGLADMSFGLSGDTVDLKRGRLPQPHVGCHSCQTSRTDAELVELESARSRWHSAGYSYVFCPGLSHDIRDAQSIVGQRELEERKSGCRRRINPAGVTRRMHSLGYFKVVNYYIRHGECRSLHFNSLTVGQHSGSSLYPDDILRRPLIGDTGKTYRSISIVGRASES